MSHIQHCTTSLEWHSACIPQLLVSPPSRPIIHHHLSQAPPGLPITTHFVKTSHRNSPYRQPSKSWPKQRLCDSWISWCPDHGFRLACRDYETCRITLYMHNVEHCTHCLPPHQITTLFPTWQHYSRLRIQTGATQVFINFANIVSPIWNGLFDYNALPVTLESNLSATSASKDKFLGNSLLTIADISSKCQHKYHSWTAGDFSSWAPYHIIWILFEGRGAM